MRCSLDAGLLDDLDDRLVGAALIAATGTVLAGQAVNKILHIDSPTVGIVVFGLLTAFVAVTGYKLIHIVGRIATVVGIVGFSYLAVRLFLEYDVASYVGIKGFDIVTFLLAISLGAGWQLTFGPYVADYSRYLPRSTSESTTFWPTSKIKSSKISTDQKEQVSGPIPKPPPSTSQLLHFPQPTICA